MRIDMKALEINQMEQIEGGDFNWGGAICGAGFAGYAGLITWGLSAALVTGGVTAVVGVGIGLVGAVVCSAA